VLFLDEPTQGLDANSRRSLWKYIEGVRKKYNTTIFLTTHYIDEAELSDRVCIINHGKIIELDTPENIKKKLLKQELIVDAEDRIGLEKELKEMNLDYVIDKHFIIDCLGKDFQDVISNIKTKINVLNINIPSLEDAYIKLLDIKEDK
jgi:ABC-2 type transport system ATP-binding protein